MSFKVNIDAITLDVPPSGASLSCKGQSRKATRATLDR